LLFNITKLSRLGTKNGNFDNTFRNNASKLKYLFSKKKVGTKNGNFEIPVEKSGRNT
jgi:hypothetical protein